MSNPLLQSCRVCGKEISRHSAFCRNCGHPQATPLMVWLLVLFLLLTLAFYVAFTIYGICHVHELRQPESSRTRSAAPTACRAVRTTRPSPTANPAACPRGGAAVMETTHRSRS